MSKMNTPQFQALVGARVAQLVDPVRLADGADLGHAVHGPTVAVVADAHPDETIERDALEQGQVHQSLHLEARQADFVQVGATKFVHFGHGECSVDEKERLGWKSRE